MATEKMSVIEFAKKRMMEEEKNGEEQSVLYWAAYLDGANAQLREDKSRIADVYWDACMDGRVRSAERWLG